MRHRTAGSLALALLLVVVLGACAGGSSAPPDGPGANGPGLDGRTFLSTGIEGRILVAGSQIRIAFQDGQISASGGCNSMSGPYRIDGDHLVAGSLATTEMGCDEPLMAQDTWLADLLAGATIALDGDSLVLAKGGVRLTLDDRKIADPDRPLLGTRWVVDGLISGDAVSSVPAGVTAALTFSDGRVEVEAGCNGGSGSVEVTDTTLAFGPIVRTTKGCGPDVMAVEEAVMAVLSGQVAYAIEAGGLTLDAGGVGLMLRAEP
jgi:heat shock protein HslJ